MKTTIKTSVVEADVPLLLGLDYQKRWGMIMDIANKTIHICAVCRKFKKTRPQPKVALSKANSCNEVVSLDLKEWRSVRKQMLYCCDQFSGYLVGQVIPNKKPETVWKALDKRWIPKKGFFSSVQEFPHDEICGETRYHILPHG